MKKIILLLLSILLIVTGCDGEEELESRRQEEAINKIASYHPMKEYQGEPFVTCRLGHPDFSEEEKQCTEPFEEYSDLDELGRCGVAFANVCKETMPTEKRGKIGNIKPSGWNFAKYDFIDGKYLYNRCHLIGYQLTGENDNEKNLITGTRYFNIEGMLPFENFVADFVKETNYHVLYRVTPLYHGNDLLAYGVQIESYSVEDEGRGLHFNVIVFNSQPGVIIDYATGESKSAEDVTESEEQDYVLNTNTKKFHRPTCDSVNQMAANHRVYVKRSREEIISGGYEPCHNCNP
jgi:DNA-entry nuclease